MTALDELLALARQRQPKGPLQAGPHRQVCLAALMLWARRGGAEDDPLLQEMAAVMREQARQAGE